MEALMVHQGVVGSQDPPPPHCLRHSLSLYHAIVCRVALDFSVQRVENLLDCSMNVCFEMKMACDCFLIDDVQFVKRIYIFLFQSIGSNQVELTIFILNHATSFVSVQRLTLICHPHRCPQFSAGQGTGIYFPFPTGAKVQQQRRQVKRKKKIVLR